MDPNNNDTKELQSRINYYSTLFQSISKKEKMALSKQYNNIVLELKQQQKKTSDNGEKNEIQ